jgi:cytochrome c oxidase subunit III
MADSDLLVPQEFQYPSLFEQGQAAIAGMWLFMAQECMFFGALMLTWVYARYWNMAGFDAGSQQTVLWIGTTNTGILITSSFFYAAALTFIRAGQARPMFWALVGVLVLGMSFLCLKTYEWHLDFLNHSWVNDPQFPVVGALAGGAKLFWSFYWIGTVLHGFHLTIGIGLVAYLLIRARRREFSVAYHTPVEVIGLYWSFVDIVWLVLWPMIYLIGRVK